MTNPGGKTALTAIFKNNIPERNESMTKQNRYLMFGAHPDDCDIKFGGTAARLIRAGHLVKFVSVCNGDCGHHVISGEELARRRYGETQAVKETAGLYEYDVMLENHDCELMPTVENRKKVIRSSVSSSPMWFWDTVCVIITRTTVPPLSWCRMRHT